MTTDTEAPEARVDTPSGDQMVRSSAAVAAGTLASRVTGLLRLGVLTYAIGGASLAATYNLANNTPNVVYELILGGVLTATLVPLFVEQLQRRDERATNAIFTVTMTLLVVLTVVAIVFAPWIAHLYTFHADRAHRAGEQVVGTFLIRLFMPQMCFYGFTALATAALNARRRFAAAAFAPTWNNIVVIGALLVFAHVASGPQSGWSEVERIRHDAGLVWLLGLGTTAGIVVMAAALLPPMHAAGMRLRAVFEWRHPAGRQMVRLSGWTIGYVIANQIALLVVLVLANGTKTGVSAYTYAYMFFQLPHGLFAVSLMTTVTPELARVANVHDLRTLRIQFDRGLRYLILVTLPASVAYMVLAQPVVGILVRGGFSGSDARITGDTLQLLAIGLLPFSVYLYALRGFYALQDTRTPFIVNCFQNGANLVLAFALYPFLGVQGLALSYAVSYAGAAVVALYLLYRRIGPGPRRSREWTKRIAARATVASLLLAAVAAPVAGLIGSEDAAHAVTAAVAGSVVGGLVYLGALRVMHVPEIATVLGLLVRRRRRAASVDV
jgi:putative peptidoglycan lipid II flippase